MSEYTGNSYSGAVQSLRKKHERITMKSLLSEAEKKEILEKNTEEVTVKNSAAHVLNLMKKKNMSIEDIFETFEMPAELQEAVLEEVRRLS
jgi:AAA+ superfamily predicted ATPase